MITKYIEKHGQTFIKELRCDICGKHYPLNEARNTKAWEGTDKCWDFAYNCEPILSGIYFSGDSKFDPDICPLCMTRKVIPKIKEMMK